MSLNFNFDNKNYRLVFKRALFVTPPLASSEELRSYKKEIREYMRNIIPSLKGEDRVRELEFTLQPDNSPALSTYKRPARWVTTSAFVINDEGIVTEVFTSICDPFDRFVKEVGRQRAMGIMKRQAGELGQAAAKCYGEREAKH